MRNQTGKTREINPVLLRDLFLSSLVGAIFLLIVELLPVNESLENTAIKWIMRLIVVVACMIIFFYLYWKER